MLQPQKCSCTYNYPLCHQGRLFAVQTTATTQRKGGFVKSVGIEFRTLLCCTGRGAGSGFTCRALAHFSIYQLPRAQNFKNSFLCIIASANHTRHFENILLLHSVYLVYGWGGCLGPLGYLLGLWSSLFILFCHVHARSSCWQCRLSSRA